MILRRRADHRRPADVDVLDRLLQCHARLGNRLLKRIEIDAKQIDRLIPCAFIAGSMLADYPAAPATPHVSFGCSVLTRPSIISGKPVTSETSVTFNPAIAQKSRGPPGADQFNFEFPRQRGREFGSPVLSETEISARRTGTRSSDMSSQPVDSEPANLQCNSPPYEPGSNTGFIATTNPFRVTP